MSPAIFDNTQTFHQALLLMASLARLTPESVLRNVMPVFTFMGSNIFHRDDSYSFRVVQQVGLTPWISETDLMCPADRQQHRASHGFISQNKAFRQDGPLHRLQRLLAYLY